METRTKQTTFVKGTEVAVVLRTFEALPGHHVDLLIYLPSDQYGYICECGAEGAHYTHLVFAEEAAVREHDGCDL
jgi:hypothetical protein